MKKRWTILAAVLAAVLGAGCSGYDRYSAKTKASYTGPDGRQIMYESDKEQVGLDVRYVLGEQGQVKEIHIKVEKSGAQEMAIAAALQAHAANAKLIEAIVPLLKAAVAKGL
jgi:hypothetical protein